MLEYLVTIYVYAEVKQKIEYSQTMSGQHQRIPEEKYDDMDASMSRYCTNTIKNRTARSSSIAIKRNQHSTREDDVITDATNYEMSTLRMFLRIMNYRMTRQGSSDRSLFFSQHEGTTVISLDDCIACLPSMPPPHLNVQVTLPAAVSTSTLDLQTCRILDSTEDYIFQLDM